MDTGFGTQFYSYEWDVAGQYRVTPDGEGYVWVYASSKWNQLNTNGETTGATDKTKWKRYKVKGKTYKRYGNKKKNRYLKSQWWKINDVWYWFDADGKSIKGSALNSMYYEYFEDAEIMLDGEQQTIYDILTDVCSNSESQLVGLLNNQMEQYCLNLFENEKLSYPTVKLDINMVDLSQTTEYKDFQSLERIHLGDSVKVFNPRLGIESTVRVIGLTYDVLRKMNTEIQIGVTETSVINLLNNIGKGSNEVRYVAGDGITIENNTISVIPPTKPYLEDVILNGESVVRNHIAYIDLDEMGIEEATELLYGDELPTIDDGEDGDIYLLLEPIENNDFVAKGSTGWGDMNEAEITQVAQNEFTAVLTGTPTYYQYEREDAISIWLEGLIDGETYSVELKTQFDSSTQFTSPNTVSFGNYDTTGWGLTFTLDNDYQEHTYTGDFVAHNDSYINCDFHGCRDNLPMQATFSFKITGRFKRKIKKVFYRIEDSWLEDKNIRDILYHNDSLRDDDGKVTLDNYIPQIEANPQGTATQNLSKLELNGTVYEISGGGGGIHYSYTEQVIGDYNGKPLYGKLVKLQNCSFTTQYNIFNRYVYNIANDFPTVRNIWVDLDASYISEMYQGIEYQRSMVFYEIETDSAQTYMGISLYHRGEYSGVDIILALRYTKTTDV
jgi:hypothetical protein